MTNAKDDIEEAWRIKELHRTCPGIPNHYKITKVIGAGSFSIVYKAEDLLYHKVNNSAWEYRLGSRTRTSAAEPKWVAIKQVYGTSSSKNIRYEIETLLKLRESRCEQVITIVTAMRYCDQVLIVLPYVSHAHFCSFFYGMPLEDVILYMRDLCRACEAIHRLGIIHRDIKPQNYCWNPVSKKGVLVDFGLAQPRTQPGVLCSCQWLDEYDPDFCNPYRIQYTKDHYMRSPPWGWFKKDPRPEKLAHRGGTSGYRAPEILLRCKSQTTAIDIWSCGTLLLVSAPSIINMVSTLLCF